MARSAASQANEDRKSHHKKKVEQTILTTKGKRISESQIKLSRKMWFDQMISKKILSLKVFDGKKMVALSDMYCERMLNNKTDFKCVFVAQKFDDKKEEFVDYGKYTFNPKNL